MDQAAHRVVGEHEPVDLLKDEIGRLAAQGGAGAEDVGLDLVADRCPRTPRKDEFQSLLPSPAPNPGQGTSYRKRPLDFQVKLIAQYTQDTLLFAGCSPSSACVSNEPLKLAFLIRLRVKRRDCRT